MPKTELEDILMNLGVENSLTVQVAQQISRDKNRWAEFVMNLKLNMM